MDWKVGKGKNKESKRIQEIINASSPDNFLKQPDSGACKILKYGQNFSRR